MERLNEPQSGSLTADGGGRTDWRNGILFGVPLRTNFPFIIRLPSCSDPPELEISIQDRRDPPPAEGAHIYDSAQLESVLGPRLQAFRETPYFNLRLSGIGWYRVGPTSIRCYPDQGDPSALEIHLLGTIFSFWLELTGRLALHGACLHHEQRGILLLGGNGSGKTTLAVELLRQGWPLLSDDISTLDLVDDSWTVFPSYPQLRLWPEAVRRLGLDPAALLPVIPGIEKRRVPVGPAGVGLFHPDPAPLAAAYLLRRIGPTGQEEIRRLTPAKALFALTESCFLTRLPRKAGLEPARFDKLGDLVERVPVFEFLYREGLARLKDACRRLEQSVAQLKSG